MKKILFLLVLLCAVAQGAWAQTKVANERELRAAVQINNVEIQLTQDIALSNYLGIDNGITVTLDLNGHTLSRNPSAHSDMGSVIRVEKGGTLTVKDSSGNNSGKLTGGRSTNGGGINNHGTLTFEGGTITDCSASNWGGGIFNAPTTVGDTPATMTMTGGVIDGCLGKDCGGIFNYEGCTLTISGGTIQNCSSNGGGGGVVNYGTATISGGIITGNHCVTRGGGVWNGQSATMTVTGGNIMGNIADLHGGGLFSYSSFKMSGNPVITGNATLNSSKENLYLDNSAVINVTGAFTEGASISVTPYNISNVLTSGYSTYNSGTAPSTIVSSDNVYYNVSLNDDGEVILAEPEGNWIDDGNRSEGFSHVNGNTIYIENEAEFAYFAYATNNGVDIGKEFVLNADLDMSAHLWTPIGTESRRFVGNFNGNGHTISGIRVNSEGSYNGLFGYVEGTYTEARYYNKIKRCDYIKNFVLTDSYIKGGDNTGGVVGYLRNEMTLENVFCLVYVIGGSNVGGIVGKAESNEYQVGLEYDYDSKYDKPNIKNNLFVSGRVTGTGNCAVLIGNIGNKVEHSNNYYLDPLSDVGNANDVRAYPVTKSVAEGVTLSYTSTNGVTYNGIPYYPAGPVNFTVKHDFSQAVVVKVNGNEVVASDGHFSFTIDPATATAYEIRVTLGPPPIKGSGTEGEPYLIENDADWNYIAYYLNGGMSPDGFSGKHFKLMADNITTSQMMGSDSHPFKGIFDGDGQTLTIAFGSEDNYLDKSCAPFDCIENATIKNLTVNGSIYSSAQNNGGLVRAVKNEYNYIRNCVSNVSIFSNRNGDCGNGGFVGNVSNFCSNVYFDGCAFVGELVGANASNWGGFVGWRYYYNATNANNCCVSFTDCLFAPKTVSIATPNGSNSRTFCRSLNNLTKGATYTRCYYTEVLQVSEGGTQVCSTSTLPANIGDEGTDYGLVTAYAKGLKVGDFYYMAPEAISLADNANNSTAISEKEGYFANVTLTGRTLWQDGGWNTLTLPFDVNAFEGTFFNGATVMEFDVEGKYSGHQTGFDRGNGTLYLYFKEANKIEAGKPYLVKWEPVLINSTDDWNTFASNVNNGTESYEGKVVKLNSDINISTAVGTEAHPFKGTFDGAGHTLNVTLDDNIFGTAPFRYISGATIANVKTTGTVKGNKHSTGLVGYAWSGTNTIKNCHVAVDVTASDKYVGGILGHGLSSITSVTDCLFTGRLTGTLGPYIGVFDAWNDEGTHSVVNCLAAGTYSGTARIAFRNNGAKNCYSKSGSMEDAADASVMSNEELLAALGRGWEIVGDNVVPKKVPTSITNPIFTKVTISKETSDVTSDDWSVTFKGTYDPVEIDDKGDNTKLYFGNGNTLYWPNGAMTINPFRAYFQLNTINAKARSIVLNFGEETTTGIQAPFVSPEGESTEASPRGGLVGVGYYSLDGRKMQGKPAQKGVYIKNGHKVVIK